MTYLSEIVGQGGLAAGTAGYILAWNNDVALSSTGTTQATATLLTSSNATVTTTVANGAFILPNDAGLVTVFNNSAQIATIFPAVGFTINNGAVNAGVNIPAGKSAIFFTANIGSTPYGNWAAIISA